MQRSELALGAKSFHLILRRGSRTEVEPHVVLPCLTRVIEHFLACRFQSLPAFGAAQYLSTLENPHRVLNVVEAENLLRPPLPGRPNPVCLPQAVEARFDPGRVWLPFPHAGTSSGGRRSVICSLAGRGTNWMAMENFSPCIARLAATLAGFK